jgi:hypothetical protein
MKSNRGRFKEGNPKPPLKFQRFQDMQLLPFQQRPQKAAHFSAVFRPATQPPIATGGAKRMGGNEVLCKGAMAVTNLG